MRSHFFENCWPLPKCRQDVRTIDSDISRAGSHGVLFHQEASPGQPFARAENFGPLRQQG
jgi:hypothetical protein